MVTTITKRARSLREHQTDAEAKLWYHLKDKQLAGYKFYRQRPIPPYYVDFVCRAEKLIIELDGSQHNEEKGIVYDDKRTAFLEQKGYRVLRFWNPDVFENIEGVLETILDALQNAPSSLTKKT